MYVGHCSWQPDWQPLLWSGGGGATTLYGIFNVIAKLTYSFLKLEHQKHLFFVLHNQYFFLWIKKLHCTLTDENHTQTKSATSCIVEQFKMFFSTDHKSYYIYVQMKGLTKLFKTVLPITP